MAYRAFRFHPGGGNLEYDEEAVNGIAYAGDKVDTHKVVSNSIANLIRRGEWCHRCDLELPDRIDSGIIETLVLRAVRDGQMNLAGMPWSMIAARLQEQRCPACGAVLTQKMISEVLRHDTEKDRKAVS